MATKAQIEAEVRAQRLDIIRRIVTAQYALRAARRKVPALDAIAIDAIQGDALRGWHQAAQHEANCANELAALIRSLGAWQRRYPHLIEKEGE